YRAGRGTGQSGGRSRPSSGGPWSTAGDPRPRTPDLVHPGRSGPSTASSAGTSTAVPCTGSGTVTGPDWHRGTSVPVPSWLTGTCTGYHLVPLCQRTLLARYWGRCPGTGTAWYAGVYGWTVPNWPDRHG